IRMNWFACLVHSRGGACLCPVNVAPYIRGIINNQLIAVGLAGEVAINYFGLQVALLACFAKHPFQAWAELVLYEAVKVCPVGFATPMQTVEGVEIHASGYVFNADALEDARTPKRRSG